MIYGFRAKLAAFAIPLLLLQGGYVCAQTPSGDIKQDPPGTPQFEDGRVENTVKHVHHSQKREEMLAASQFPTGEIERYEKMPFETWRSPRQVSELSLPIEPGFAQPYPYGNLMRQFDGDACHHRGIDVGTYGETYNGIGSPVNAMTKSVVTLIGRAGGNVNEFGTLDIGRGDVPRMGRLYPKQLLVPGYGLVYPFSTNYGRWRSGTVLVTKVLEGPYKDYTIRYMHLADIRHDLRVGSVVMAGEHIGIMGGTAILESCPHVHIDMEDPKHRRVDPAPLIGIPGTAANCVGDAPVRRRHIYKMPERKTYSDATRDAMSSHTKSSTIPPKEDKPHHKKRKTYLPAPAVPMDDGEPVFRELKR